MDAWMIPSPPELESRVSFLLVAPPSSQEKDAAPKKIKVWLLKRSRRLEGERRVFSGS
jgi:hypothetical protein